MEIAGRKEEVEILESLLDKNESSFVALYGRRRVGKTFLIFSLVNLLKDIFFSVS